MMRDGNIISPRIEVAEPLKTQCSHFLDCITHGTSPLTSGWDGSQVVRVMEAIDRSIKRQGAPTKVKLGKTTNEHSTNQLQATNEPRIGNSGRRDAYTNGAVR